MEKTKFKSPEKMREEGWQKAKGLFVLQSHTRTLTEKRKGGETAFRM